LARPTPPASCITTLRSSWAPAASSAIGPTEEIDRRYPGAARVGGRGKAVFPGLVNGHTHLWLTVARGIQEDLGFPSTIHLDQSHWDVDR
jgi:5-methylthioadenosine/S-adenosylhomocysteine deaminase